MSVYACVCVCVCVCKVSVFQIGLHNFIHNCHAMLNDILHKALSSAIVPSRLEPTGVGRADGKRPDEITMIPGSYNGLGCYLCRHFCHFPSIHRSL